MTAYIVEILYPVSYLIIYWFCVLEYSQQVAQKIHIVSFLGLE